MLHLNSTSRPYLGKTEYAFLTNAHHHHRTPWPLFCKDDGLLWWSSRTLPVRSSAWRDLMPDMQPCCSYARHRTTWQCWERAGWRKGQQGCATEYHVSVSWVWIEDQWRKFVKQYTRVRKWHNLQPVSSVFSPLHTSFQIISNCNANTTRESSFRPLHQKLYPLWISNWKTLFSS